MMACRCARPPVITRARGLGAGPRILPYRPVGSREESCRAAAADAHAVDIEPCRQLDSYPPRKSFRRGGGNALLGGCSESGVAESQSRVVEIGCVDDAGLEGVQTTELGVARNRGS